MCGIGVNTAGCRICISKCCAGADTRLTQPSPPICAGSLGSDDDKACRVIATGGFGSIIGEGLTTPLPFNEGAGSKFASVCALGSVDDETPDTAFAADCHSFICICLGSTTPATGSTVKVLPVFVSST